MESHSLNIRCLTWLLHMRGPMLLPGRCIHKNLPDTSSGEQFILHCLRIRPIFKKFPNKTSLKSSSQLCSNYQLCLTKSAWQEQQAAVDTRNCHASEQWNRQVALEDWQQFGNAGTRHAVLLQRSLDKNFRAPIHNPAGVSCDN